MNAMTTHRPADRPAGRRRRPPPARILRLLQRLRIGRLDLQLPDGTQARFGGARDGEPQAALRLLDWAVCSAALKRGDIGFAEAFIDGRLDQPGHRRPAQALHGQPRRAGAADLRQLVGRPAGRASHLLNRNSRRGSRKNIHAHYDIGNPFYRLWLDETMNYSSALFEGDTTRPMAQAQQAKVRRALREVRRAARAAPAGDRLRLGRAGRDARPATSAPASPA